MGKKVGNVEIDGQIDGRFTSYYDADKHGSKTGETVAGSTADDNGDERTDDWPSAVDADPEDLTEKQEAVIRAAARYPDAAGTKLAEIADCSQYYPYQILEKYWPERHDRMTYTTSNEPTVTTDDVVAIRRRLLAGASTRDLADEFDLHHSTVSDLAQGETEMDVADPPPLTYDRHGQIWTPVTDRDDDPEPAADTDADTQAPAGYFVPRESYTKAMNICQAAEVIGGDADALAALIRDTLSDAEEVSADGE